MLPDLSCAALDEARRQGDPAADDLVAALFSGEGVPPAVARRGYNHLLDLMDRLIEAPGLHLVEDSSLARSLSLYPESLRAFFEPQPTPDWVDEEKLALAAEVWESNSLAILFLLYTSSLPHCYLIENGIPILYETARLRDRRYVYQRVFETGVFLEAALERGGMEVEHDLDPEEMARDILESAARSLDGSASVESGPRGLRLVSEEGGDAAALAQRIRDALAERQPAARRWLWGPGVLATRKVRVLHAAMRYMVLNPDAVKPLADTEEARRAADAFAACTEPWDDERRGHPINQEDMAYTLLTFSLVILDGLEHLGARLSREKTEAWLHGWRVVGHVLGVRDDLTSDDPDECREIFERIRSRQAGRSDEGVALTCAILDLLKDFFPRTLGLGRRLVPVIVRDVIGPETAEAVLSDEERRAARSIPSRALWWTVRRLLGIQYFVRRRVLAHAPLVEGAVFGLMHRTAEGIVESWRDTYDRKPFYVPATFSGGWKRCQGIRDDLHDELVRWRTRVFDLALVGIGFGLVGCVALLAALVPLLVEELSHHRPAAGWLALTGAVLLALGGGVLGFAFPSLLARRPQPESRPILHAESAPAETRLGRAHAS